MTTSGYFAAMRLASLLTNSSCRPVSPPSAYPPLTRLYLAFTALQDGHSQRMRQESICVKSYIFG